MGALARAQPVVQYFGIPTWIGSCACLLSSSFPQYLFFFPFLPLFFPYSLLLYSSRPRQQLYPRPFLPIRLIRFSSPGHIVQLCCFFVSFVGPFYVFVDTPFVSQNEQSRRAVFRFAYRSFFPFCDRVAGLDAARLSLSVFEHIGENLS